MASEQVEDAVRQVVDAWTVTGRVPAYHRAMQALLADEWPTLARSLDHLARSVSLARSVTHDGE